MQSTNYQASDHDEPLAENVSTPKQAPSHPFDYHKIEDCENDRAGEGEQQILTTSAIYTRATSSSKQPRFLNKE